MKTAKKVRRIRITFIVLCLIIIQTVMPVSAEETIILAYNGDPKELAAWKFVHLVTDEIFRHLNISLKYEVMPAKRAGFEANNGRVDGDNARVYEYNKQYPNLLKVRESVYTQALTAYAIDPAIHLTGWDSLRDKKYKVEYLRGVIFVEKNYQKSCSLKI